MSPPPLSKRKRTIGIYLRCLNATLAFVLLSTSYQIIPLLGTDGILPADLLLDQVHNTVPGNLIHHLSLFPTLCWCIGTSNTALIGVSAGGGCVALLACVVGGPTSKVASIIATACLVSIIVIGGDFYQFPWDFLLIEAMFLSLFLPNTKPLLGKCRGCSLGVCHRRDQNCRGQWKSLLETVEEPTAAALLATHFLLFRFMYAMGIEKIPYVNNEPTWHDLTFLARFYETEQPLPTAASWVLTKFPMGFHKVCVVLTWTIELVAPLMIFGPTKWQYWSGILQATLMVAIHVVGNYATFQIVTIILMIPLFTDSVIGGTDDTIHPSPPLLTDTANEKQTPPPASSPCSAAILLTHAFLGGVYLLRVLEGLSYLGNSNWMYCQHSIEKSYIPAHIIHVLRVLHPWRIVNQYGGIFHDTFPHEGHVALIIRGSNDGNTWLDYELKFSIQNETSFPQFFAPFQPRFDHAAFYEGTRAQFHHIQPSNPFYNGVNGWLLQLIGKIMEGDDGRIVDALFGTNPFPNTSHPPKYMSVITKSFKFDTIASLYTHGTWLKESWTRQHLNTVEYCGTAAAALSSDAHTACVARNCQAVLQYLGVDYVSVLHNDCDLPTVSKENVNGLWNTATLAPELALTVLPTSYRETMYGWSQAKLLDLDKSGGGRAGLIPLARAIYDIAGDEIAMRTSVDKYQLKFGHWPEFSDSVLHSCFCNLLYVYRVGGDENKDTMLDVFETRRLLTLLGHTNAKRDAIEVFEVVRRDEDVGAWIAGVKFVTFQQLLESELFVRAVCVDSEMLHDFASVQKLMISGLMQS